MVGRAGEWPAKATSPALGLGVPIALRCGAASPTSPPRAHHTKAYVDLPKMPEIARVHCQCLRPVSFVNAS
jgi:hypothetical protein